MNLVYNIFKENLLKGFDFEEGSFKISLMSPLYIPSVTDSYFSDVSSNEVSGSGYTAGGKILTGVTVSQSGNYVFVTASNAAWDLLSATARGAVVYKDTGVSSTSPLVAYYDFGSDQQSVNGNFIIRFGNLGFITIEE